MEHIDYFSASKIKMLTECKKLFYNQYILKSLPDEEDGPFAQLGTALHAALEEYRPNHKDMARKHIARVFADNFPPGRKHWLYKEGIGIIYNLDYTKVIRGDLVEVEWPFEKDVLGWPCKGFVDKIERVGGGLLCTDYKSNKAVEPQLYVMQLAIYDAAIKDAFPGEEVEHELLYLRHNKSVPFKFTEESHDRVRKIFENTDRMINENADDVSFWHQKPKRDSGCSYCPLKSKCWK